MKKVLFTATVDSHILHFHLPYLKLFKDNGYEVHVATNGKEEIAYTDVKHTVSFERSPYKINNLKAIKQLKKIIEDEKFDIIHCHTPMGSVVTRIAAKKARKKGTKVIYTAHGFHFYKGAPLINWILFYPIEKILSRYTDTLITINNEDFELAKRKFKKTNVEYVPGVGIDPNKFDIKITEQEKKELRKQLGLKDDDFVMIYPAEISKRKRQMWLINSIKDLLHENKDIHLLLPGKDSLNGKCNSLVKELNLEKQIHLLGYRKDIQKLLRISNLSISTAKQEGLPVNLMEAMYVGIPIVASNCRGNRDLVKNDENGCIIDLNDSNDFCNKILKIKNNDIKFNTMEIEKKFLLKEVLKLMTDIYIPKKRILHILASNKYSGAENVACTIINSFKKEFDVAYCSPDGSIKEVLKEKEIKYFPLKKLSINELKKVINTFQPNIIHAHDYRASFYSSIFSKNRVVISHLHNNWPFAKKWNLKTILYNLTLKKYDKVIGVSKKIFEEAIFKKKIKNKYTTIYNYVDKTEIINKSNEYEAKEKYDLFFIGRLTPQKNPLLFIEIIEKLSKKLPKIKAVMIGDGEMKNECEELIKKHNLKNNIKLLGFKKNPFPIIKNCKICIMPSKWEGFGLTAIESMILEKMVLNSGKGGLAEIFENNQEYICNDIEEYIDKIINILKEETVERNTDKIIDKFTNYDDWKNKFKNIYN